MKSSVGVTICAVVVLIASALALLGTAGAAFAFAGPLSGQLFDPANLPPGADVRLLRSVAFSAVLMGGVFSGFGIATGIGLIRLWKWARYAAIVLGSLVVLFSVIPGILFMFVPAPAPQSGADGPPPAFFRLILVSFYLFWSLLGGLFVYMMARKSTADQFNGGAAEPPTRVRPISVTIIAWLMLVSGLFALPMLVWGDLPAMFLGMVMTGKAAKVFYVAYMLVYAIVGLGLIKRTRAALTPAIAIHAIGLINAVIMFVPSVWTRYQAAIAATTAAFGGGQSTASTAGQYFGLFFGVAFAGAILFFLVRARRTLAPAY